MTMPRRTFLAHGFAMSAAIGTARLASAQDTPPAPPPETARRPEPSRQPPFDVAHVKAFVGAGHGNLPRVKEMLGTEPRLALASYDWGGGDFETALGGASHTGRREIALHLLDAGARIDAFCAAMLGETAVVAALIRSAPATARTRGPHGYSLLYHAGHSGVIPMGEVILAQVEERARDCNQALHAASVRGHAEFVAWLLTSGADNPSTKDFAGKTPLDRAVEQGHDDVVKLLRARGGLSTR